MAAEAHLTVLRAYDDTVDALYGGSTIGTRAASAQGGAMPEPDDGLIDAVIAASDALTPLTAQLLESEDPLERESGEVRLAALAARDFAVALDLAQLDEEEGAGLAGAAGTRQPILPEVEAELAFVLASDPARGVPPDDGQTGGARLAGADDDESTGDALKAAAAEALKSIREDGTEVVLDGIGKLGSTGLDEAFGKLIGGVLDQIPSVRRFWKRAVKLFKQGIEKLKALFGAAFEPLVKKIKDWLGTDVKARFGEIVLQTDAIQKAIDARIAAAPADKDFAAVAAAVKEVAGKHATQKTVLLTVFKVIDKARKWLLRLLKPHGDAIVIAAYALGIAYGVYSAGDYSDWFRVDDDGFLDFVHGVRQTVEDGLA